MIQDKKYYVYVHKYASGPKEGKVFYVGKGQTNRAKSRSGRNDHWNKVYKKYGMVVEFIMENMTECCAMTIERILINFYGIENLANITLGGDGWSGAKHSEETREKLSIIHSGKKLSEEHKANIGIAGKGRPHSMRHRVRLSRSHRDEKVYTFIHDNGESFTGKRRHFIKRSGVCAGNLSNVINGKFEQTKGWRLKE